MILTRIASCSRYAHVCLPFNHAAECISCARISDESFATITVFIFTIPFSFESQFGRKIGTRCIHDALIRVCVCVWYAMAHRANNRYSITLGARCICCCTLLSDCAAHLHLNRHGAPHCCRRRRASRRRHFYKFPYNNHKS